MIHRYDRSVALANASGRQIAAYQGKWVDPCVASHDGAGAKHGVASYLDAVTQYRAHLLASCWQTLPARADHHLGTIPLEIGGDRSRAEMDAPTQHRVADVIEMRHRRAVKENAVFQLCRISDHTSVTDQRAFTNKCTMPNFGFGSDD